MLTVVTESRESKSLRAVPMSGAFAVRTVIGLVVGLILATVATFEFGSPLPLVLAVIIGGLNAMWVVASRRRAQRRRPPRPTGKALAHPAGPPPTLPTEWRGGANIVGPLGRFNASHPLATLAVTTSSLRLDMTGVGALGGVEPLVAEPSDIEVVFPVRGMFLGPLGAYGVALQPCEAPVAYFWTWRREEVLAALEAAGFTVSWLEQRGHAI